MKVFGGRVDRSISFKLIIPLTCVLLGSVLAFLLTFHFLSIEMREQKSQQRAIELAEIVASSIERSATKLSIFGIVDSLGSYKDIEEIYLIDTSSSRIITANKHQYKNKKISSIKDVVLNQRLLKSIENIKNEFILLNDNTFSYSYHFSLVSKDRRSINKVTLFLLLNSKVIADWLDPFFNYLLVFMLVLFSLSMLLFFLAANSVVVYPIKRFIKAISDSEYQLKAVVVPEHSNDEIGELVKQYNSLMVSLGRYQHNLELEKEKSELSAKAKSEFLATMTHEIRTPLNGIIGMSELLNSTQLTQKQKHYAQTIRVSGAQLLTIINDVLDFSKIESGKMELNESVFDLLTMINNCMTLFKIQCTEKFLALKFDNKPGLQQLYIEADEVRLRQVLINLLGNAIKFTKQGSITIELDILNQTEQEVTFSLAVIDTGIGISDDKAKHLFEEFTQADSTTTRDFGGTGLGLAICKKICEKMLGRIYARGELGVGSRFTVELTLAKKEWVAVDEADELDKQWAASAIYREKNKPRVLLVEDTAINLEIAQEILQDEGFFVEPARDGQQAVAVFKQGEFDIILMDCLMPVMDGFQATEAIRNCAHHNAKSIPIIALTASSLQETKDKCMQAGMNDFISKPFESRVLLRKIKGSLLHSSL